MNRLLMFLAALPCAGPPAALLCAGPAPALAEPYWVAYEGDDFPENEGWVHTAGDPPAERWLDNGRLVIDSRSDIHTTDVYAAPAPDKMDPGPGEMFMAQWSLKTEDLTGFVDPGIVVTSDQSYSVSLIFQEGAVYSVYEPNVYATFEPGAFHDFELTSTDMRAYELYIDGSIAFEGVYFEGYSTPGAGFGDVARGGASLTRWDYVRFGVVPEPHTFLLLLAYICISKGAAVRRVPLVACPPVLPAEPTAVCVGRHMLTRSTARACHGKRSRAVRGPGNRRMPTRTAVGMAPVLGRTSRDNARREGMSDHTKGDDR